MAGLRPREEVPPPSSVAGQLHHIQVVVDCSLSLWCGHFMDAAVGRRGGAGIGGEARRRGGGAFEGVTGGGGEGATAEFELEATGRFSAGVAG